MPKTHLEKIWLGGGCFIAFIMILIGYFFFIGPQRSNTDAVNSQVDSANMQNSALQARINTLNEQNKNLAKYQAEMKAASAALPSSSGLPDFLRTIQAIGSATLANVSSETFGTPTDVTAVSAAAPAAGAAPAPTTEGLHIYALPITVQASGSVAQLNDFLAQLQSVQPRAVLISQIAQTSGATAGTGGAAAGSTALTLTMNAFVAPTGSVESAQLQAASH